jgi:hypothetical protein
MKEEALDEKLIGNQKKLDKNHNNKLDSEDFKMLRGKKMEEAKKPKPDYLDMDNDGNKKESMKKAIKDKKMKDYRSDRDKHGEMEEEVEELDELSKKTLGSYINKATADATDAARRGGAADAKNAPSFAKGAYKTVEKRQAGIYNATKKLTKEEVEFSAEELAHIASIMEADAPAVAKVDANKNYKVNAKGNEVGTSPTAGDLTDETITEGRRKPGVELKKPGRPVGSKSGSRHASSGNKGEDEVSAPSAVPHVLDQIRHAHERGATDEHGTYTLTHPADRTKTAKVSRKEAHGFYTDYHGTEKPEHKEKKYKEFLGHHFGGDDRTHAPTHHAFNTDLGSIEKANLSTSANRAKVTLAKTGK